MRKHWFAAIFAALLVIGAGTAIASIPNGSETEFSVADPAVSVIATGTTAVEGGTYSTGTTFFTVGSKSFTAAADGVCMVSLNGEVLGSSSIPKITYGIAQRVGGGSAEFVGQHGITALIGRFSENNDAAVLAKNELVPVVAGKTYTFGFGIEAASGSGTAFPVENYICFG